MAMRFCFFLRSVLLLGPIYVCWASQARGRLSDGPPWNNKYSSTGNWSYENVDSLTDSIPKRTEANATLSFKKKPFAFLPGALQGSHPYGGGDNGQQLAEKTKSAGTKKTESPEVLSNVQNNDGLSSFSKSGDSKRGRKNLSSTLRGRRKWQRPALASMFSYQQDQQRSTILPDSTLAYRYYGRSQKRTLSAGSTPFLLLGPNVDHWKVAAQELAARGFNVMVCETIATQEEEENSSSSNNSNNENSISSEEVTMLLLELLDALRWRQVVLVGCDQDALEAIHAALKLAPERVVGLVLCGDLTAADRFVLEDNPELRKLPAGVTAFAIDQYLDDVLECPFLIVWDGDNHNYGPQSSSLTSSSTSESSTVSDSSNVSGSSGRSQILGGGSAPHRRRPQHFAWVLTRFVEENIAPAVRAPTSSSNDLLESTKHHQASGSSSTEKKILDLPFQFFPSGALLVAGRIAATMLCYGIVMKVAIFQYENVRQSVLSIKLRLEVLASQLRRIVGSLFVLFSKKGGLGPFLWGKRWKVNAEEDAKTGQLEEVNEKHGNQSVEGNVTEVAHNEREEDGNDQEQSKEEMPEEDSDDDPKNAAPPSKPMYFLDHIIA